MTRFLMIALSCLLLAACSSPEERVKSYMANANEYYESGEYEKARLEIANALQIDPKHAPARILSARLSMDEESYESAFRTLQLVAEIDPENLDAHVLLGKIYYMARASERLENEVAKAEQIDPSDSEVQLLRAKSMALNGDDDTALVITERVLEKEPDFEEAVIFKAAIFAGTGRFDEGLAVLDAYIEEIPVEKSEEVRNIRVLILDGAGRTADLESELRALARDFPETDTYSETLINRYIREGKIDEAEAVLQSLVDLEDGNERRMDLVSFVALQRSEDAAIDMTRMFLEEDPDSTALLLGLGQLLESEERLDEAMNTYERLINTAPNTSESFIAKNRIVSIYVRQEKAGEARELVEDVLRDNPNNVDALLARAAFNYMIAEFDDVIADARVALRKDPDSIDALLFLARGHIRKGEMLLAQDAYSQILAKDFSNQSARNELANSYVVQGDLDAAEDLWREKLDSIDSRIGLIRVLRIKGEMAEAEEIARGIIEENSSSPQGYIELALIKRQLEEGQEAEEYFSTALEVAPDSILALRGLVDLLVENEKYDSAIGAIEQSIAEYPGRDEVSLMLASVYGSAGKSEDAESIYRRFTESNKRAIALDAFQGLAVLYPAGSEERIEILLNGLDRYPGSSGLSLLVAAEYYLQGQVDEAIAIYEKAYSMNQDNNLVANNLAATLLEAGQDKASRERALEISKRFRDSQVTVFVDTLGWAYYKNSDFPNAVVYLERVVAADGSNPVYRYHLGMAYAEVGNTVNARQELEKAVEMSGDDGFDGIEEAKSMLNRL